MQNAAKVKVVKQPCTVLREGIILAKAVFLPFFFFKVNSLFTSSVVEKDLEGEIWGCWTWKWHEIKEIN